MFQENNMKKIFFNLPDVPKKKSNRSSSIFLMFQKNNMKKIFFNLPDVPKKNITKIFFNLPDVPKEKRHQKDIV